MDALDAALAELDAGTASPDLQRKVATALRRSEEMADETEAMINALLKEIDRLESAVLARTQFTQEASP